MLSREQAREQLKAFEIQDARQRRLAAAKALRPALREIVTALLDRSSSFGWSREQQEKLWKTIAKIEALSARDRQSSSARSSRSSASTWSTCGPCCIG